MWIWKGLALNNLPTFDYVSLRKSGEMAMTGLSLPLQNTASGELIAISVPSPSEHYIFPC